MRDDDPVTTGSNRMKSFRISDEIWDRVHERAARDGVNNSDVVRMALLQYLNLPDPSGLAPTSHDRRSGRPARKDTTNED